MRSLRLGIAPLVFLLACPTTCLSKWMFGFYSQDVNITSYEAGSNLFLASDLETAVIAKSRGMSSLFYTAQFFVITFDRQSPDICKLRPTWQSDWNAFAAEVAPYISNGTIIGFWLGDELAGRCCTLDTIKLMAQTVKASFPNSIVYYNEAAKPLQEGKPCAKIPQGGYHLAGAVDWFGMDLYHFDGVVNKWVENTVQPFYKQYIQPLLHTGQKLVLVPASFSSDVNHHCDRNCYIKMIKNDATDYVKWANSDSRVAAIIPWHWDGCEGLDDCMKHLDEIGTAEIPELISHWKGLVASSLASNGTQGLQH